MSEWWTYRPSDFLMFSPRTYWRLVELYNRDAWPAPLVALAGGLAALSLAAWRGAAAGRAVALLLVPAWLWVGWAFHWERYAQVNWAARTLAIAFAVQAFLLLLVAALPRGTIEPAPGSSAQRVGLGLTAAGVLAYPIVGWFTGRPWIQAEVFGMAPDPTALATLGLLMAAGGHAPRAMLVMLAAIPLASLLLGMATLWVMAG